MILTNPNGTSYQFQVEDVVLLIVEQDGSSQLVLRGVHGDEGLIDLTPEQLAQVREALGRL